MTENLLQIAAIGSDKKDLSGFHFCYLQMRDLDEPDSNNIADKVHPDLSIGIIEKTFL